MGKGGPKWVQGEGLNKQLRQLRGDVAGSPVPRVTTKRRVKAGVREKGVSTRDRTEEGAGGKNTYAEGYGHPEV